MAMALCRRGGFLIIKSIPSSSSSSAHRSLSSRGVRPVAALTEFTNRFPSTPIHAAAAAATLKFMSTDSAAATTSSKIDSKYSIWKNIPPKDDTLLGGCDFEHWLVVMEFPQGEPSRDEIIASYINTLSKVLGSEEEARMKIYSVSTRHYFAFGALVSEELAYKIKELPEVRWVLPDSYLDVENKDYGGEPFINGKAVPYDPKYHEEWVRNNTPRGRKPKPSSNLDCKENVERQPNFQPNQPGPPQGGSPRDVNNSGSYQVGRAIECT